MAYIFKPGDKAYWIGVGWIELVDNPENDSYLYPLFSKDSYAAFTAEGKKYARGGDIVLLPLNPYDPFDPNNPPEFRYPFMLNGRPVFEGSELHHLGYGKTSVVTALFFGDGKQWCGLKNTSVGELSPKNFCWPDSLPKKKTTYLWAVPMYERTAMESLVINFIRMTKEEAGKYWKAEMVPGSEEEE